MLARTSPVPEKVKVPLFWNVLAAMDVVPDGVPIFSEKIVLVVPPPPPEGKMVMVRLVLPTPTEFEAETVTTFVPATGVAPEITPLVVLMVAHPGKLTAPNEVGELEAVIW